MLWLNTSQAVSSVLMSCVDLLMSCVDGGDTGGRLRVVRLFQLGVGDEGGCGHSQVWLWFFLCFALMSSALLSSPFLVFPPDDDDDDDDDMMIDTFKDMHIVVSCGDQPAA